MNTRHIRSGSWQHAATALLMLAATSCSANAQAIDPRDPRSPLHLTRTIELKNVRGRIDHLALDPRNNRLFIAELGNDTVDEVDLTSGTVMGRISGLREPQGVAWLPAQDEIAVASGDGSVRFYRQSDRQEVARISLGDDADNVRIDPRNQNLVVGYGSGGLAVIEPKTHRLVRQLHLPGHPEAFAILGSRVFVNVPDAHEIVICDLDQGRIIKSLATGVHFGNYPMAEDIRGSRIGVAFRVPSVLSVIDAKSGATRNSATICGDADDLFFRDQSVVIVCGEGVVEIVDDAGHRSVRVATRKGARTGLIDFDRNRLFVAVPAHEDPVAIWELSFQSPTRQ